MINKNRKKESTKIKILFFMLNNVCINLYLYLYKYKYEYKIQITKKYYF